MSDEREKEPTVLLAGSLTKKGGVTSVHWKTRYFVLTPKELLYCKEFEFGFLVESVQFLLSVYRPRATECSRKDGEVETACAARRR